MVPLYSYCLFSSLYLPLAALVWGLDLEMSLEDLSFHLLEEGAMLEEEIHKETSA